MQNAQFSAFRYDVSFLVWVNSVPNRFMNLNIWSEVGGILGEFVESLGGGTI